MKAQHVDAEGNLAGEGAKAGLSSGLVVGGTIGVLAGIGLGFVRLLGFLVAGPIAGLLTGAAAGAVTGGALGGLVGLGIPQEEVKSYEEQVRRGGTLVIADVPNADVERFERILNSAGATNINDHQRTAEPDRSAPVAPIAATVPTARPPR